MCTPRIKRLHVIEPIPHLVMEVSVKVLPHDLLIIPGNCRIFCGWCGEMIAVTTQPLIFGEFENKDFWKYTKDRQYIATHNGLHHKDHKLFSGGIAYFFDTLGVFFERQKYHKKMQSVDNLISKLEDPKENGEA